MFKITKKMFLHMYFFLNCEIKQSMIKKKRGKEHWHSF
jgi:hypothetical protein